MTGRRPRDYLGLVAIVAIALAFVAATVIVFGGRAPGMHPERFVALRTPVTLTSVSWASMAGAASLDVSGSHVRLHDEAATTNASSGSDGDLTVEGIAGLSEVGALITEEDLSHHDCAGAAVDRPCFGFGIVIDGHLTRVVYDEVSVPEHLQPLRKLSAQLRDALADCSSSRLLQTCHQG